MRSAVILTGLLCSVFAASAGSQPDDATIPWLDDLDEARARAMKEGKPLFIVFR